MKTNFQMLRELLEKYHPQERGFVSKEEAELIKTTLHLAEMDVLALRNLRDYTVSHMSRYDTIEDWDKMSAITYVIDTQIVKIGGEV